MESLKEVVELASGNAFIQWLNEEKGTNYSFFGRADRAPDLVYKDGDKVLEIEHTAAYYDGSHAKFVWDGARKDDDVIGPWIGCDPHDALASEIKNRISEKSKKDYGKDCILLIEVPPGVTSIEELRARLRNFSEILDENKFKGVYVAGRFPMTSRSYGGYHVIEIKKNS